MIHDERKIKCVIWDLDNTLWNGILLEDENVSISNDIIQTIKVLDSRGILQSVSSKNNFEVAISKLKEFELDEYFLYPQINWNSKSSSIKKIIKDLNIGIDSVAFIDDQEFELQEVKFELSDILCINSSKIKLILDMPEMIPDHITDDAKNRRLMYINDIKRNKEQELFEGPHEEFLASLNMVFSISAVQEGDLERAEELTVRTHQLNTVGHTYSYDELNYFRLSNNHKLIITSLKDKFGSYGKVGLALIECNEEIWIIKLLLMSCRVMSRGVGSVLLNYIMASAKKANVRLLGEFVPNDRNRMMYITYSFAGFKEIENNDGCIVFESDLNSIQRFPEYITVEVKGF